jgi:hypothetical protein
VGRCASNGQFRINISDAMREIYGTNYHKQTACVCWGKRQAKGLKKEIFEGSDDRIEWVLKKDVAFIPQELQR